MGEKLKSQSIQGSILVLIAGIAWGISGVSGQYLLGRGVTVEELTTLRLLISGFVLVLLAIIRQCRDLISAMSSKQFLGGVLLFALLGLVANQFTYLKAIEYTNAGTATVLQYLTPIIVLGYTCIKNRIPPALLEVISIILAIAGTFLLASHGQFDSLAINPQGLAWGITSAFTYTAYIIIPVAMVKRWGSQIVIGVAMLIGGIIFAIVTRIWTYRLEFDVPIVLAYVGIIFIGTILAYTLFLQGTSMAGAVQGSLLASIEPVASVVLTVAIFHIHFYHADILGMIIILIAATIISLKDVIIHMITRKGK